MSGPDFFKEQVYIPKQLCPLRLTKRFHTEIQDRSTYVNITFDQMASPLFGQCTPSIEQNNLALGCAPSFFVLNCK